MVLNNYWKLLENNQKNSVWGNGSDIDINIGLRGLNGGYVNILQSTTNSGYMPYVAENLKLDYNMSVRVGYGDTPVTAQDYALENDVTSSLSNISTTFSSSSDDTGVSRIINFSAQNLTNSAITINKVAVAKGIWSVPSNFYKADILLAIVELDSPITVSAGGNFNITFSWDEV